MVAIDDVMEMQMQMQIQMQMQTRLMATNESLEGRHRAGPEPDYGAARRQLKPNMSRRFRECVGEGMQDSWPVVLTCRSVASSTQQKKAS